MQEVLECASEIKVCNRKEMYLAELNHKLDEAERDNIRGELFTGSVITAVLLKTRHCHNRPHRRDSDEQRQFDDDPVPALSYRRYTAL